MNWISVKDRLPEIGKYEEFKYLSERLLMSDGTSVYWGQYECSPDFGMTFLDPLGNDLAEDDVVITHWVPLPEPPKDGE